MTLRKVYVRYREDLPENEMMYAAESGFRQRGVEVVPFYGFGDIDNLDDLGVEVGLVGFIGDVWRALKKMGIEIPPSLDYPDEIREFLGRGIRKDTLGYMRNVTSPGKFLKPVKQKLFTGFVFTGSYDDQIRLAPYADEEEIWVSSLMDFVAEFRCFIMHGGIVDVRRYRGDWGVAPNKKIVEAAVKQWVSKPDVCVLDFGVTDYGSTCLVEANDGFSVGHYGLDNILYAKFTEAKWVELTAALRR